MNNLFKYRILISLLFVIALSSTLLYIVFDSPKYNYIQMPSAVSSTAQSEKSETEQSGKININTADFSELKELYLIGDKKAQAIIEYREKNGKFRNTEELTNVNGISDNILQRNIDRICV